MALFLRSDVEPIDPSQVPLWVSEITIGQYFQVAIVTVLVYDTLTTMDKEVKYFWRTPRNTVNVVYFAGSLIEQVFHGNFAQWTRNITNSITIVLIDYILMIRVLALYSQDIMLSLCLKVLLALEAVFKLGLSIYVDVTEDVVMGGLAKGATVCGVGNLIPLKWGLVDWIIPMAFGVILMALALYKAAEYWKMSAGLKGFTLVKVLVLDQLIYFMLAVACAVFNILQFKIQVSNDFSAGILSCLGNPTFLCILGSRMLVNLKEAGEQGLHEGTSYGIRSRSVSDMEFA